jgi:hypothetical protein
MAERHENSDGRTEKDIRIMRTPEEAKQAITAGSLAKHSGLSIAPSSLEPTEGNLMLRLDMLIAKNQDLLLYEDIDNFIEEFFVQLF